MIPRFSAATVLTFIGLLSAAAPAAAQPATTIIDEIAIDEIAIFATNSIDIKDEAEVLSGAVVVNGN